MPTRAQWRGNRSQGRPHTLKANTGGMVGYQQHWAAAKLRSGERCSDTSLQNNGCCGCVARGRLFQTATMLGLARYDFSKQQQPQQSCFLMLH